MKRNRLIDEIRINAFFFSLFYLFIYLLINVTDLFPKHIYGTPHVREPNNTLIDFDRFLGILFALLFL